MTKWIRKFFATLCALALLVSCAFATGIDEEAKNPDIQVEDLSPEEISEIIENAEEEEQPEKSADETSADDEQTEDKQDDETLEAEGTEVVISEVKTLTDELEQQEEEPAEDTAPAIDEETEPAEEPEQEEEKILSLKEGSPKSIRGMISLENPYIVKASDEYSRTVLFTLTVSAEDCASVILNNKPLTLTKAEAEEICYTFTLKLNKDQVTTFSLTTTSETSIPFTLTISRMPKAEETEEEPETENEKNEENKENGEEPQEEQEEEPEEQPEETKDEESVEEPAEEIKEETAENEELAEESEEPVEESSEETEEEKEKPAEESAEEIEEEPAEEEQLEEESVEELTEEPVEESEGESEELKEQSDKEEKSEEDSAEESAEESVEEAAEEPKEETGNMPNTEQEEKTDTNETNEINETNKEDVDDSEDEAEEETSQIQKVEIIITKALKIRETWRGNLNADEPSVLKLDIQEDGRVYMLAKGGQFHATVKKTDCLEGEPFEADTDPETGWILMDWNAGKGSYLISLTSADNIRSAYAEVTFVDEEAYLIWNADQERVNETTDEPDQKEDNDEITGQNNLEEQDTEIERDETEEENEERLERSIDVELSWETEEPHWGDIAHFHTILTGYEGLTYFFQWQTSPDMEHWDDVPGETGQDLDIVITGDNNNFYWRVVVYVEEPKT